MQFSLPTKSKLTFIALVFPTPRAFSSIFAVSHFLADHLSVERMPAKAVGVEG
jgi:hypothetical protein